MVERVEAALAGRACPAPLELVAPELPVSCAETIVAAQVATKIYVVPAKVTAEDVVYQALRYAVGGHSEPDAHVAPGVPLDQLSAVALTGVRAGLA
jgi:hypothetical protein